MEPVELILKIVSIISLTMLKFLFGPALGYAAKLPMWATMIITVVGMMSAVIIFTFVGDFIRDKIVNRFFKKGRTFSKSRRMMVTVWQKYGVIGVAFLTPVLFTPIPGTLVLVSFRTPNAKIFLYMLLSALFWSVVATYSIYELGEEFLPFY